jgi:hypothetical protein
MPRWTVNPPMGQVIGGWIGAMIVLGIAGGWLFGPSEVTLHTVPPRGTTSSAQDGHGAHDAQRAGATQPGRPARP